MAAARTCLWCGERLVGGKALMWHFMREHAVAITDKQIRDLLKR